MAETGGHYQYSVIRDVGGPGYTDVALVRFSAPHGMLEHLLHHSRRDAVVLQHRTFKPLLELADMEAYAAQLERTAEHGNQGTLGCFVQTEERDDGIVRVELYDRWFDGDRLRCEQLAQRDFDAGEQDSVVTSAEFLTELQAWAAERNSEREASYRATAEQERADAEQARERAEAARELQRILASHNEPE